MQGVEEGRLLLSVAIAVPLVMEPVDDGVMICRVDPRSGRTSIESASAGVKHRAVHMIAQAGAGQQI